MKLLPLFALVPLLALPLARSPLTKTRELQEHDEETELSGHMEKVEDTVKVLRKNMKDPATWPAALEALVEIQRLTLSCKSLAPSMAANLPEAERGAFVTAFRHTMVDFLMRQLEIEAALLDGDAQKAQAAFDLFRAMEDSSHERFAPEDD